MLFCGTTGARGTRRRDGCWKEWRMGRWGMLQRWKRGFLLKVAWCYIIAVTGDVLKTKNKMHESFITTQLWNKHQWLSYSHIYGNVRWKTVDGGGCGCTAGVCSSILSTLSSIGCHAEFEIVENVSDWKTTRDSKPV